MGTYIFKRILMMIPTLFGITIVSFIVINLAPGGPVEQRLQAMRFGGKPGGAASKEVIEALNKQYGFDKPVLVRYGIWLKNLSQLNFGTSFKYEEPVIDVIVSKMPVSIQFGIVSLILTYLTCIPLGVLKALRAGSAFDVSSSVLLFVMLSIPPVMLAVILIVFFAGGSFFDWFPLGGLSSDAYSSLSLGGKIWDRIHHAVLPLTCYLIGSFTFLTILMKNSMLDIIKLDYIRTAQAKGLANKSVYMKHALRNALIPIVTGMSGILTVFFAGSIIVEQVFQLDGMGLLGLTAVNSRDYNVLMGLIFIESLLFLVGRLVTDIAYVFVDPRIDFA